jgi:transcriptional regulator with XRE-family HTH domain
VTTDPVAAFAANLRRLRAERGLNKAALARLTGVNQASISNIENEKFGVTLATAGKIADGLRVPLAEMITEAPEGTP